jgi:hypothetical protein
MNIYDYKWIFCLEKPKSVNQGQTTFYVIDGVVILVYSPEKTIADCFKFRNKLGLDVVLEALKLYKERGRFNIEELLRYGGICRAAKIMKPYLEAMV